MLSHSILAFFLSISFRVVSSNYIIFPFLFLFSPILHGQRRGSAFTASCVLSLLRRFTNSPKRKERRIDHGTDRTGKSGHSHTNTADHHSSTSNHVLGVEQ
jgi:hypothetical protein